MYLTEGHRLAASLLRQLLSLLPRCLGLLAASALRSQCLLQLRSLHPQCTLYCHIHRGNNVFPSGASDAGM